MEKIERQDALIKEMTTMGIEEQPDDVLKHEDSKCSPKPKTSSEGFLVKYTTYVQSAIKKSQQI